MGRGDGMGQAFWQVGWPLEGEESDMAIQTPVSGLRGPDSGHHSILGK